MLDSQTIPSRRLSPEEQNELRYSKAIDEVFARAISHLQYVQKRQLNPKAEKYEIIAEVLKRVAQELYAEPPTISRPFPSLPSVTVSCPRPGPETVDNWKKKPMVRFVVTCERSGPPRLEWQAPTRKWHLG